ncbi:spore coat protein [Paenibacillaceae bacterium]|nr:spore coat protein [Paenibacillaceae bacterium]
MAYSILADLKRVCSEYTTAATESSCPEIRQLFTNLQNSSLKLQGELFQTMKNLQMYSTSSPALRQEIDKQIQQNQQTHQKTSQFLQQINGQGQQQQQYAPHMNMHNQQQAQQSNPSYYN